MKLGAENKQQVGFKTILKIKTTDQDDNIVTYPGGSVNKTQKTTSENPTINYGTVYNISQPAGATRFVIDVIISTIDCGRPISGITYNAMATWEFTSPNLTYPNNYTVLQQHFNLMDPEECF